MGAVKGSNGSRHRASADEIAARIEAVKEWLAAPLTESSIVHRGVDEWNVSPDTVKKYIRRAIEQMETLARSREAELILRSELTDIKDQARRHADFGSAILAALILAKMNGVVGLEDISVVVELRR